MNTLPALISSPAVKRVPEFDALAEGGGITVNIPYFRDITDQADAPQVEATQPTMQKLTSGKQIAPMFNRETGLASSSLAAAVSGADPVANILAQIATRRQKQRQATLVNILRGIFGFSTAPNGAGALAAVRNDVFLEAGANPASNQLISPFVFADTIARLGELADTTIGGGILMHPLIRASLIKQDQIAFEHYSTQEGVKFETYKGYRVFASNLLVRAGTGGGYVFDTYIFAPGVFAWGEKPQVDGAQKADAASMRLWVNPQTNVEEIYDRTRFLLHPNGLQWKGNPAGQSATNAELATAGNWALDYATADRCGIVCLRSNG
ncbi:MAG: hypothetical protein ABFD89_06830 [Bryobacteraceae bacterium]